MDLLHRCVSLLLSMHLSEWSMLHLREVNDLLLIYLRYR